MENVEAIPERLLELVRLDMKLRKTGEETAERRQVEDASILPSNRRRLMTTGQWRRALWTLLICGIM